MRLHHHPDRSSKTCSVLCVAVPGASRTRSEPFSPERLAGSLRQARTLRYLRQTFCLRVWGRDSLLWDGNGSVRTGIPKTEMMVALGVYAPRGSLAPDGRSAGSRTGPLG